MRRTQIYLTEEQDRLLMERARDQGLSKAEVIRRLLDERLGNGPNHERAEAIRTTAACSPTIRTGPNGSPRCGEDQLRSAGSLGL